MALNLWKLQKALTFNPLPTGWTTFINLNPGDYQVKVTARSASSAQLQLDIDGTSTLLKRLDTGATGYIRLNLTPVSQTFTIPFNIPGPMKFYLYDPVSKGDIAIDNVELVQKPLPKLTINGIDGFQSGKWTLHPNAVVVDDSTLVLNATAGQQYSSVPISVEIGKSYVLNLNLQDSAGTGRFNIARKPNVNTTDSINAYVVGSSVSNPITFTADQTTVYLNLYSNGIGQFTFRNPMLNLGSTPAPYSRKTGDKMVMPTAKKNLISSLFTDSSWTKPAQAVVVDGYNVTINATGDWQSVNITLPVIAGKTYSFSAEGTGRIAINKNNSPASANDVVSKVLNNERNYVTFTADNTYNGTILVRLSSTGVGTFSFKNPQLEEGTTATPYSPYAVQVNKKPQKWVAKKNLFDGKLETDGINGGTGAKATDGNRFRTANYTKVKPNTAYIWSGITADGTYFFDANYTFISGVTGTNQFTTPSNAAYALARFLYSANPSGVSSANVQLEEGSTATPYEPFQLVLPKAKTGLAFNGVTDYLQLPSMTMDSIEIECLIDPVQVQYAMILDARTGLGGALNGSLNTDFKNAFRLWIDGVEQPTDPITIPRNKRIKIKVLSPNIFTDDVTIFTHYNRLSNFLKGTLYKVTCYLNGGIIAQYDFENPRNIVGNQVIPNAQNLIPSFEDSRWSIHPNAKVLGKDVLHLDATAVSQGSRIKVPVIPNTQYKFVINCPNGTRMRIGKDDGTTNGAWLNETNTINTFTAPSDCQQIIVTLENNVAASGSFDFIRPQLYQLTGQEGTINGSPVPQLRHAKRRLYSKR